ncbi:hypothetical protein LTR95_015493 [Oleoguttula sp. CCFEE 5521]
MAGSTGFVGFRTLRYLLEHGYRVRAAVRSDAKAELVRSNSALKEATKDNLSFVVIPDFTAPTAYDGGILDDVTYIVHVASPIPDLSNPDTTNLEARFVQPAVAVTTNLLEAARSAKQVKRIVITSSVAGIVPSFILLGQTTDQIFGPHDRGEELPAPYHEHVMLAYATSKVAALVRAEAWVKKENPPFDLVHIFPTYVLGRDPLVPSVAAFAQGSNAALLNGILGHHAPAPVNGAVVHIDDVGLAHVRALDPKVPGNRGFILNAEAADEKFQWDHGIELVAKFFPEAVNNGDLVNNGTTPTGPARLDSSETRSVLGIELKGFEVMVKETVGWYLEVLERERKGEKA